MERYRKFSRELEDNPETQIVFHKRMMRVWTINAPIIFVLYIISLVYPRYTLDIQGFMILYTAMVSLYANWVSDFDGLSAAQSTLETIKGNKVPIEAIPEHLKHL